MNPILQDLVAFVAILNPFALCLYLVGLIHDLNRRDFFWVMTAATAMSLAAFVVFAFGGDPLLRGLGIRVSAMRMFGGLILLGIAYNYVMKGYKAAEMLRGSLDELPSAIAMPFMIGAGTITQAIMMGRSHPPVVTAGILVVAMGFSLGVVCLFYVLHGFFHAKRERVFNRYINILARLNGLLIGAIAMEMTLQGAHKLWAS